jgi:hypothetical protein
MNDDVQGKATNYLNSLAEKLASASCEDSRGRTISRLNEAEQAVLMQFLLEMVRLGPAPKRIALNLPPTARKYVVLYAAILPLIEADAELSNKHILYLAPNANTEAGAQLEFRAMTPFTLSTQAEFGTWEQLEPRPENGFKTRALDPFWIIGDLDTPAPLDPDPKATNIDHEYAKRLVAAKRNAVNRVLRNGSCPALLLHQEGQTSLVNFPPVFGTKPAGKGGCFIATAACGSELAPEVDALRDFRDQVLLPTAWGRLLVSIYERVSPPIARWIAPRTGARSLVRNLLIQPLVRLLGKRI